MLAFGSWQSGPDQNQMMHGAHTSCLDRKLELQMKFQRILDLELSLSQRSLMRALLCRLMAIWPYDLQELTHVQGISCEIMQAASCIVSVRLYRPNFTRESVSHPLA